MSPIWSAKLNHLLPGASAAAIPPATKLLGQIAWLCFVSGPQDEQQLHQLTWALLPLLAMLPNFKMHGLDGTALQNRSGAHLSLLSPLL